MRLLTRGTRRILDDAWAAWGVSSAAVPLPEEQMWMCFSAPLPAGAANCSNVRCFSIQPENTVYSGPVTPSPKRVTLRTLQSKYKKGEPISMVTAYDYPSAVHVSAHACIAHFISNNTLSFTLEDAQCLVVQHADMHHELPMSIICTSCDVRSLIHQCFPV